MWCEQNQSQKKKTSINFYAVRFCISLINKWAPQIHFVVFLVNINIGYWDEMTVFEVAQRKQLNTQLQTMSPLCYKPKLGFLNTRITRIQFFQPLFGICECF